MRPEGMRNQGFYNLNKMLAQRCPRPAQTLLRPLEPGTVSTVATDETVAMVSTMATVETVAGPRV